MSDKFLIATLMAPPKADGAELHALHREVNWLEVRADLVRDIDSDWLRNHFRGRLLFTLRSREEGGAFSDSAEERRRRLAEATANYDAVDLESQRDFSERLLSDVPIERRWVSWCVPAGNISKLKSKFDQLSSIPASTYRMVTEAATIQEELTTLLLLKSLRRFDSIIYSNGPLGFWSRVAALHLGAPAVFGSADDVAANPSEPSINKLIVDYGLPQVKPANELFAIIGDPVFHSLSPRLHNRAYRQLNYPALFVPLRVKSFEEFWREAIQGKLLDALGMPLTGLTVASPHKEAALLRGRQVSPMAQQAGSANILVRTNGWWRADTTDPDVVYMAARDRSVTVKDKRAAVIGCGGAGRAIAAALAQSGAGVTLINRGEQRGQYAARLLALPYIPLSEFSAGGYDIVVNATPVGRDDNDSPFDPESLNQGGTVIDLVYGLNPTPLVKRSRLQDRVVIDGRDVLLTQVTRQFCLMTGTEMPLATIAAGLGKADTVSTTAHHGLLVDESKCASQHPLHI